MEIYRQYKIISKYIENIQRTIEKLENELAFVNWLTGAVKGPTHQIVRDGHLQGVPSKLDVAVFVVNATRALEDLDNRLLLVYLKDLTLTH